MIEHCTMKEVLQGPSGLTKGFRDKRVSLFYFYGSLEIMKINHATFTDALQIAMSIDGASDWREQLAKLVLPKGWSIAVAVDSTIIFDVGFIDPWTTAGVHHDLVNLGLRTPDMLTYKFVLDDLANSTWKAYERAISSENKEHIQESAWRQLGPLLDHVVKSRIHLQSEWSYLGLVVEKFKERIEPVEVKLASIG
jgi:hypothetical protein